MLFQLTEDIVFPEPSLADQDGLLAIGGDLSEERLLLAYQNGIFPWYSKDEPILWYSPHERFVMVPEAVKVSHSMKQLINAAKYEISWNTAFSEVIHQCSNIKRIGQGGTWIHEDMQEAYIQLHKNKIAQSVEVWQGDNLVGGLYGVVVGKVFCGESMFSKLPNTSKLALIALCHSSNFDLIDCQVYTEHLEKMGAKFISRGEFMETLKRN